MRVCAGQGDQRVRALLLQTVHRSGGGGCARGERLNRSCGQGAGFGCRRRVWQLTRGRIGAGRRRCVTEASHGELQGRSVSEAGAVCSFLRSVDLSVRHTLLLLTVNACHSAGETRVFLGSVRRTGPVWRRVLVPGPVHLMARHAGPRRSLAETELLARMEGRGENESQSVRRRRTDIVYVCAITRPEKKILN